MCLVRPVPEIQYPGSHACTCCFNWTQPDVRTPLYSWSLLQCCLRRHMRAVAASKHPPAASSGRRCGAGACPGRRREGLLRRRRQLTRRRQTSSSTAAPAPAAGASARARGDFRFVRGFSGSKHALTVLGPVRLHTARCFAEGITDTIIRVRASFSFSEDCLPMPANACQAAGNRCIRSTCSSATTPVVKCAWSRATSACSSSIRFVRRWSCDAM